MYVPFQILFHYRLSLGVEYSLCCVLKLKRDYKPWDAGFGFAAAASAGVGIGTLQG